MGKRRFLQKRRRRVQQPFGDQEEPIRGCPGRFCRVLWGPLGALGHSWGGAWRLWAGFWGASEVAGAPVGCGRHAPGCPRTAQQAFWVALGPFWKPPKTIFEALFLQKMCQVLQIQSSAWFSLALAPECAKLQLMQLRNPGSTLIPETTYMRQSNCKWNIRPLQQND